MDHERSPSGGTAQRFATCAAHASPGGPRCGEPTTRLLILTCAAEHGKLAGTCEVHAAIAQELTDPGALSVCGLCEDLTGTAEPMTIARVEPWDPTPESPPPYSAPVARPSRSDHRTDSAPPGRHLVTGALTETVPARPVPESLAGVAAGVAVHASSERRAS